MRNHDNLLKELAELQDRSGEDDKQLIGRAIGCIITSNACAPEPTFEKATEIPGYGYSIARKWG